MRRIVSLIYSDLSYKIVGILYRVYNELGGGYQEKYYQRAARLLLIREKIRYKEQLRVDLKFDNQSIGSYYLDFLIDNKVILELKVGHQFYNRDIKQVLSYLKATGLRLGILALFSRDGLKIKRIVN